MAVVGKMEVDLYANTTPFIAGLRAGDAAARKSASGIGASIERINKKQLTNIAGNMIKAFGAAGIADKAFRLGAEFMDEFTRGGNFEKSFAKIGEKLLESLSSTPVVGAAFELGKSIGNYITDGALMAEEAQQKSRVEALAKQKKFIEEKQREDTKLKEDAEKAQKDAGLQKESLKLAAGKKILDLEKQASDLGKSARDLLIDELTSMPELTYEEFRRGMAAFDTVEAYNQQEAALERIKDEQKEIADMEQKAQEDLNDAVTAFGEQEAALNKKAEQASSGTSLDTAIGAVKIEGATDFSIEKQLETARDQLEAAETSAEYLKIIASQLGGTV